MAARSRLEARIAELGLPVAKFAVRAGVVPKTAQRWIEGHTNPRRYQLSRIADALDVPLDSTPDKRGVHWYLVRDDKVDGYLALPGHDDDVNRREFLAGMGGISIAPASMAAPIPPEIVGYLSGQLTAHWQADRVLGPHLLIDHVVSQCHTVTRAVAATTGALHRELVPLAAASAGLVAWLYQDIGDLDACNRWLGETLDMGHRSGDSQLVAYALTCKAMVRLDLGDGVGAVDLALAALATSKDLGAKARAMALQHAAHGQALLGDRAAVDRSLDELGQLLESLASDRHPWGGDRLRHDPSHSLNVQRATCYERLGLADESAALWADVMRQPPLERRDRGVHLARQAIALVDAGDPTRAAAPAAEGARYLAATGSARMRNEFIRLRHKASGWSATAGGQDLADVLDAIA